jgi:hypothetical protein
MEAQERVHVDYRGMKAVRDNMGKTLRVDGTAVVEGGGFAVLLAEWDGIAINPDMLMVALVVTPTGESPSEQPLRYDAPWEKQYSSVGFVGEGYPADTPPSLHIKDVY